jgi:hypothetical protein
MSGFLEKYNTDEVFLRLLIVSMLRSFNDRLTYIQINDQQEELEIYVPFYFSLSGDEAFIQDFYIEYKNCTTDEIKAEGNYDILPRGIVSYQSSEINIEALTNKYVRMSYTKEDKTGEMKTFSSHVNSIPLVVTFNVAMKTDSLLDAFKLYENVLVTFFKTYSFSFEYGGMRIVSQIGFPESYEVIKQLEFTYEAQEFTQFNFVVSVETYLPTKDLTTERFRGNLMQGGIKMEPIIPPHPIDKTNGEIL